MKQQIRQLRLGSLLLNESNNKEVISDQVLFGWVRDRIRKRWEAMWARSESAWTKSLIKQVGKKLVFPRDQNTGISYVRALLNNAAVADNMLRMNLSETSECECGEDRETVEHVLLKCRKEVDIRNELMKQIENIWMGKKTEGGLQFDLNVILYPFANDNLSDIESREIMQHVFSFIRRMSRNL